MKAVCVIVLGLMATAAVALVRPYSIEPQTAALSGWTGTVEPYDRVGQYVVCVWDSLSYPGRVELFTGDVGGEGRYNLDIKDSATSVLLAHKYLVLPKGNHQWLKFDTLDIDGPFVRGRTVLFSFTRESPDSIHYYFRQNEYAYGNMVVGGVAQEGLDLACRVTGVCSPLGPDWWGANCNLRRLFSDHHDDTALTRAHRGGLRWIRDDLAAWNFVWDWGNQQWTWDEVLGDMALYQSKGLNVLGILCYCSSDTAITTQPPLIPVPDRDKYPPRNLWQWPDTSESQPNYWARYVESVMVRLDDVEHWQVWNEANIRDIFFGNPDTLYYGSGADPIDTPRERCSLYVRMCYIAKKAAAKVGGRKIVAGAASVRTANEAIGMSPGVEWVYDMFDIAEDQYGGADSCFDILSVHPYPCVSGMPFDIQYFQDDLDTARAVIRAFGSCGTELWATEIGWNLYYWNPATEQYVEQPGASPERSTNNLCEFYSAAIGSAVDPKGRYDRAFWYELTDRRDNVAEHWGFGLLDSSEAQNEKAAYFGYSQFAEALTDGRLNGRVVMGDSRDDSVRVYEFDVPDTLNEPRRVWIAWRTDDGTAGDSEPPPVAVQIPIHTNAVEWEYCAYSDTNARYSDTSALDGWFDVDLTTRPRFIFEPETSEVKRPDLLVDSVWVVPEYPPAGQTSTAHCRFYNHGSDSTRTGVPAAGQPNTFVRFYSDDSCFETIEYSPSIAIGETVYVDAYWQPTAKGNRLLKATANETQAYVEEGLDDNAGFQLVTVSGGPGDTAYFGWEAVGKDTLHRLGCKTGVGAGCTANDTGSFAWGYQNAASGRYSAVSGGSGLTVTGDYSGASGHGSTAATVGQDSLFAFVSQRVAINGTSVDSTEKLKVNGDANVTGILRADSLIGPLNGNAQTADSCKGGATRATLADSVAKLPDSITGTAVQVARVRPGTLYGHTGSGNSVGWDSTSGTAMGSSSARVRAGALAVGTSGAIYGDATIGATTPVYIYDNQPTIGMNVYSTDMTNWKFGEGSSSKYGSLIWQDVTNGYLYFYMTNAAGSAGNNATMVWNLACSNAGTLHANGVYGAGVSGRDVYITSGGQFGYNSSSRKVKLDIKDLTDCDWLLRLRPVTFRFDSSKVAGADTFVHYGLIAEEVQEVNPLLVSCDTLGNPETVNYDELGPVLLAKVLQLEKRIAALEAER